MAVVRGEHQQRVARRIGEVGGDARIELVADDSLAAQLQSGDSQRFEEWKRSGRLRTAPVADHVILELAAERDRLKAEVQEMQNLTRRMSDEYLDLDLLDERAREMLGLIRADEVILR